METIVVKWARGKTMTEEPTLNGLRSNVVLGMTVLDIGCRLTQEHRLADPEAFPAAEGVVVAVFDWGVRLAEPTDMINEWDCYTENYVIPNGTKLPGG